MLNAVKRRSYLETLSVIDKKATTPEILIECVNSPLSERTDERISFSAGSRGPYVSKGYLLKLCEDSGISAETDDLDDIVRKLIEANVYSGMSHFKVAHGYRIQEMERKMNRGEDVSEDFANIKARFAELLGKRA